MILYFREVWKNISISKKLYFVVGVMAVLLLGELLTLRFSMQCLSAARGLVGAESLWSKAQKNAVFSLERFGNTRDEANYNDFLSYLKLPAGDHQSRMELFKSHPDLDLIRQGFLQGKVHPDDVTPVVNLLLRFYWVSYLKEAIQIWGEGDRLLSELTEIGVQYHHEVVLGQSQKAKHLLHQIQELNVRLTKLEEDFSFSLGEGSRWLEHFILFILTIAVLTVEGIGLSLAFSISRSISIRLNDLQLTAHQMGQGDFSRPILVDSTDEIGRLSKSLLEMGDLLQRSYRELEARVQERTVELEKMVGENSKLYEEAKAAIQMRDEFLSVASHELRTPLTALSLELQLMQSATQKIPDGEGKVKIKNISDKSLRSVFRLRQLLDELLDLTRIRVGKFNVNPEAGDLVPLIHDVVSRFGAEAASSGAAISIHTPDRVLAHFDSIRMEQVMTNLISNAIKYGAGSKIEVSAHQEPEATVIRVRDRGPGISAEKQAKIFERYERAEDDPSVTGMGLGLYIAKQIILSHRGQINFESELGKGTEFIIRLPRVQRSA